MKARVVMNFELENGAGEASNDYDALMRAAHLAATAIHARLVGDGFLPDDLYLYAYDITPDVVE